MKTILVLEIMIRVLVPLVMHVISSIGIVATICAKVIAHLLYTPTAVTSTEIIHVHAGHSCHGRVHTLHAVSTEHSLREVHGVHPHTYLGPVSKVGRIFGIVPGCCTHHIRITCPTTILHLHLHHGVEHSGIVPVHTLISSLTWIRTKTSTIHVVEILIAR